MNAQTSPDYTVALRFIFESGKMKPDKPTVLPPAAFLCTLLWENRVVLKCSSVTQSLNAMTFEGCFHSRRMSTCRQHPVAAHSANPALTSIAHL